MSEAGSTGSPVWFDISGAWAVHTVRHQETQCLFSDFEGGVAKKRETCEQSNGPMDKRRDGHTGLQCEQTRLQLWTSQVQVVIFMLTAVVSGRHKPGAATAAIAAFVPHNRKAATLIALIS